MTKTPPFRKLLIANRGEVAVRIIRACRELGISPVAVCSEVDQDAVHVRLSDEAVVLGSVSPRVSYLSIERILDAAARSSAEAIHPGYGFLSENAEFAQAVVDAGLVWVGPTPDVIRRMGNKTASRRAMEAANVPVVPGYHGSDLSLERLEAEAERIGYPLLVKAAFGGGGKGMRLVQCAAELRGSIAAAQREARGAFGDGTVYLERFIERPRHIEVQVLGDKHGNIVHFFERECSIQRRHQKIIEESPSPVVTPDGRKRLCETAVRAARAVGYESAGTFEFIYAPTGEFYFLEANTRLQVEHPVTELVSGVDLVQAQIRIAAGERLPWRQADIHQHGHAIECRVYAEDPETGFLPSTGRLLRYEPPTGPGIRHDGGVRQGSDVLVHFDPMLAKLCVWAEDRDAAIGRMVAALEQYVVHGVRTNIGFLLRVVSGDDFGDARFHTRWVDERFEGGFFPTVELEERAVGAAALAEVLEPAASPRPDDGIIGADRHSPWTRLGPWRLSRNGCSAFERRFQYRLKDADRSVSLEPGGGGTTIVRLRPDRAVTVSARMAAPGVLVVHLPDGRTARAAITRDADNTWVTTGGETTVLSRGNGNGRRKSFASGGDLTSPLPGRVIAIDVDKGQRVSKGQILMLVEAMKMEHPIKAPHDGVVLSVRCKGGDMVQPGVALVELGRAVALQPVV